MNAVLESQSRSEDEAKGNSRENLEAFNVLFSRYRRTLSLVAYRVLGNHEEAEEAVQNCLGTAADDVPQFEHEGAFRCWLVRVLIDEAVLLLDKQNGARTTGCAMGNEVIVNSKTSSLPTRSENTPDKSLVCSRVGQTRQVKPESGLGKYPNG